ncbi:hypothetical protein KIPE111705_30270 [Kibdelosporangium persicum]|uniref:Uncharacterized protein n=1 Tax=Kibdelosporangium persicum TaxID=2698649 RepID=A0ABX2F1D4_9PSEU|nr:hypothetical protein [Kibdelosporangium persicum]NRN65028.1 hypothetical protein [Kibdelosporangium persicum]
MKWLLWTQIALVLASVGVGVIAAMSVPYGAMVPFAMGALPLLLIAGAVLGLLAVRRKTAHIPAAIALLAPVALIVVSELSTDYEPVTDYAGLVPFDAGELLVWLNWVWWLDLAAAALALMSALLLFRLTLVRRTVDRQDRLPD